MIPKERIFVKGDDMTKYQSRLFIRAVKKSLRERHLSSGVKNTIRENKKSELPKYITDNPYYP